MKKKILSCICLLLATVGALTGCQKSGSDQGAGNGGQDDSLNPTIPALGAEAYEDIYETTATGKNIIENRTTDYKILIPDDATNWELTAADELKFFLAEATGLTMSIVKDSQATAGGKYISLGATALAASNGVSGTFETLGQQGFGIKTVGDNLYVYGATGMNGRGVLYGVYGFLENELHYDYFYTDVYTIDKTDTLALNAYDIVDVPDIQERISSWSYQSDSPDIMNRMRMTNYSDVTIPVDGTLYHTALGYFPLDTYKESNPEFYTSDFKQLCYLAGGNEESLALMKQIVVDTMWSMYSMEAYQDYLTISFSMTDSHSECECSHCLAYAAQYGESITSTVIAFCNDVAEMLERKFIEAGDDRADKFRILFYAYFKYETPPMPLDSEGNYIIDEETGEYEIYEDMKLDSHVVPMYAALYANYTDKFDCAENADTVRCLEGWQAIADEINFWGYDLYNRDYQAPFNSFAYLQYLYQYIDGLGCEQVLMQGQPGQQGASTGFALLKSYLQSKLGWDVNADVAKLTDRFFRAMYGNESGEMKAYYQDMLVFLNHQREVLGLQYTVTQADPNMAQYWPKNLLLQWQERLEKIEARLEKRGDTQSAKNVRIEMCVPLFHLVTCYEDDFDSATALAYKKRFVDIVREAGMTQWWEGPLGQSNLASFSNLFSEWGVA